jgi:hypothetical protein
MPRAYKKKHPDKKLGRRPTIGDMRPAAHAAILKAQTEGDPKRALQAVAKLLERDGLSHRRALEQVRKAVTAILTNAPTSEDAETAKRTLGIDLPTLGQRAKETVRKQGIKAGHKELVKYLATALVLWRRRTQPELAEAADRNPRVFWALATWGWCTVQLWAADNLVTPPS